MASISARWVRAMPAAPTRFRSLGWKFALAVGSEIDLGKGALAAAALAAPGSPWIEAVSQPIRRCWERWPDWRPYSVISGRCISVFAAARGRAGTAVGSNRGAKGGHRGGCLPSRLFLVLAGNADRDRLCRPGNHAGGGFSLVPAMWLLGPTPLHPALGALAITLAILLMFTHRSNLTRMATGNREPLRKARSAQAQVNA